MKGVRYFLASVIALVALTFTFYLYSSGLTGNVVNSVSVFSSNPAFFLHDLSLKMNNNVAEVSYFLSDFKGKAGNLNVLYEVYDADGNVYVSGESSIVVNGNSDTRYGFSFKSGNARGTLMVSVQDGEDRSFVSRPFSSTVITGDAVSDGYNGSNGSNLGGRLIFGFLVFLVFLMILFYFTRKGHNKKQLKHISKLRHESGFINLDLR